MSRRAARRIGAVIMAVASAGVAPRAAAHGFGQRFDLPLPLWLWLTGAGTTIALTFVVMALFVRDRPLAAGYPQLDLYRFSLVRRVLGQRLGALIRVIAVALFAMTLYAGFFGNQSPYANLITTMIWVVWWVGVAFFSALIGNLWPLINPLSILFQWAEALLAPLGRRRRLSLDRAYPEWLGVWPAVLVFLGFAWAELIWEDKDVPRQLATVLAIYAVYTWVAMLVFGRENWLRHGEAFSIVFGVLAKFAPFKFVPASPLAPEPRLYLRPPGAGLISSGPVSSSFMVLILLMLSSVTFDGFQETSLMLQIDTRVQTWHAMSVLLFDLSEYGFDESRLVHTVTMCGFVACFVAVFWSASWIMLKWTAAWGVRIPTERVNPNAGLAARSFVLTLVPIAVAYHLSHYFSLLLTAGQFIVPLASDPFGFGSNLFGTAHYRVDLAIVSPYVFWYGAVAIIVLGHVIAVYLAHLAAWRLFASHRGALISQVPMLLLMVAYTTLSLWILAQPIVGPA